MEHQKKTKVGIVILNWNGSDMLRRFLPSVIRHATVPDAEVWVADNASTDDSVPMLAREFPTVRVLALDANYGFAEGYNKALAAVDASYYLLLNSDVEVTDHWLEPLLDYMDAHPEVAACQPKIRSWRHPEQFEYAGACGGFLDKYGYPFCRGRIFGTVETDRGQYDDVVPVFWATGAAMCIRSDDYWATGGLDGRFFAHMEEIDLCWRLHTRGRRLVCIPQSVVYHVGGATLQKENPRKTFLNFRNNLLMLYKNLPDAELRPVMRVRCLLDYLAALQFVLTGQWANAREVVRARKAYRRMRDELIWERDSSPCEQGGQDVRVPYGILWRYYVRGVRRFSQLRIAGRSR